MLQRLQQLHWLVFELLYGRRQCGAGVEGETSWTSDERVGEPSLMVNGGMNGYDSVWVDERR
jgi:hypothetical protein